MIEIGEIEQLTTTVTSEDTANALTKNHEITVSGDIYAEVLATTKMIALMELVSGRILQKIQNDKQLSVGVGVNIQHLAPTPVDSKVTVTAEYLGQEGKLYKFKVEAYDARGKIGEGEHTRAIIDIERLLIGANKRI